ncbi:MAG: hypothetical protein ABI759_08905 [Candidatus Solibacter sp.]
MPDTDFAKLEQKLAELREQVSSQLAELRREVIAMLAAGGGGDAVQARIAEWERREAELTGKLASKEVDYQTLRAQAELDVYRQQVRLDDLERQLALREAETAGLKSALGELAAEHADCALQFSSRVEKSSQMAELRSQLQLAREECDRLHRAIEGSVALKVAGTAASVLRPLRALFARGERR